MSDSNPKNNDNSRSIDNNYTDESIQVLKPLEAIRMRPGMYVGSTDADGLHHLIWEILDNSVDEMQAGYADTIRLVMHADHQITVSDNGRGIPTGINVTTGTSNLLVVFTSVHAGAKFDDKSSYKTSGGLHGVGSTCVNALSEFMHVTVWRDGKEFLVKFKNGGQIEQDPVEVGEAPDGKTGTVVTWKPDFTIFDQELYDHGLIEERIKTLAFLNEKKRFEFEDEVNQVNKSFYFENGLRDWIFSLNDSKNPLGEIFYVHAKGEVKDKKDKRKTNSIEIEFAFQYKMEDEIDVKSFCNNIVTSQGGTHLEAVKDALLFCIRERAIEEKIVKRINDIDKSDIVNALTAVVSLKYQNPQYSGQTKGRLNNAEVREFILEEIKAGFHHFLEENPETLKLILQRVKISRDTRLKIEATKFADKQISERNFFSYADKLADCTIKDPEVSELYIVEGDSAGGSAKSARDRDFQAILPVKGKLMNIWKAKNRAKFSSNKEISGLISSIGCGYDYGNSSFDISKLGYNKIIIMTDADVDGSHIRTLILTFIYKFMYPLIEEGKIYIAQPPLYRASTPKQTKYFKDEQAKDEFIADKSSAWEVNRFKGLGEMSPDQLWDTTMNPETRTLLKITPELIKENQDKVFDNLMGEKVKPRTEFIMRNYHQAKMIDV